MIGNLDQNGYRIEQFFDADVCHSDEYPKLTQAVIDRPHYLGVIDVRRDLVRTDCCDGVSSRTVVNTE